MPIYFLSYLISRLYLYTNFLEYKLFGWIQFRFRSGPDPQRAPNCFTVQHCGRDSLMTSFVICVCLCLAGSCSLVLRSANLMFSPKSAKSRLITTISSSNNTITGISCSDKKEKLNLCLSWWYLIQALKQLFSLTPEQHASCPLPQQLNHL